MRDETKSPWRCMFGLGVPRVVADHGLIEAHTRAPDVEGLEQAVAGHAAEGPLYDRRSDGSLASKLGHQPVDALADGRGPARRTSRRVTRLP